jgi:hypothetical protein
VAAKIFPKATDMDELIRREVMHATNQAFFEDAEFSWLDCAYTAWPFPRRAHAMRPVAYMPDAPY